jgi:hypothetical protein
VPHEKEKYLEQRFSYTNLITNTNIPLIHFLTDQILTKPAHIEILSFREFSTPRSVMAGVVLMYCLLKAAMERKVVFI